MSNLSSCWRHTRLQWQQSKAETRHWFKARSAGSKLKNVLLSPWAFTVIFIILATYWNALMSVYVDQTEAGGPPMPDRLHDLLGRTENEAFASLGLALFLVACFIRFLPIWNGMTVRRASALAKRFLLLESLMQVIRGFVQGGTSLIPPDPICVRTADGNVFLEGLKLMTQMSHTCGDLYFSGHTAFYTLIALFWTFYSQGEEFNFLLPRRFHVRDWAHQRGADERTHASDGKPKPDVQQLVPDGNQHDQLPSQDAPAAAGRASNDERVSFSSSSPLNWPPPRRNYTLTDLVLWTTQTLLVLALIWARDHYTGDTYVSFVTTQLLFRLYHSTLLSLERKLRMRAALGIVSREATFPVASLDTRLYSGDNLCYLFLTWPERFLMWYERAVLFRPDGQEPWLDMSLLQSQPQQLQSNGFSKAPALPKQLAPSNNPRSMESGSNEKQSTEDPPSKREDVEMQRRDVSIDPHRATEQQV